MRRIAQKQEGLPLPRPMPTSKRYQLLCIDRRLTICIMAHKVGVFTEIVRTILVEKCVPKWFHGSWHQSKKLIV